jgi:hypothetical protein
MCLVLAIKPHELVAQNSDLGRSPPHLPVVIEAYPRTMRQIARLSLSNRTNKKCKAEVSDGNAASLATYVRVPALTAKMNKPSIRSYNYFMKIDTAMPLSQLLVPLMNRASLSLLVLSTFWGPPLVAQPPLGNQPAAGEQLPESHSGIAARYPRDVGIAKDGRVILAEDFEVDSIEQLEKRWDMVRNPQVMSFSDLTPEHSHGRQSLLIAQVQAQGTGGDLFTRLKQGQDEVYMRVYVRFAEDCEPVHHFGTCLGGNNPPTPWPKVRAGQPTQGNEAFWFGIEPFGDRWRWDYYAYWHEMRGSPPRGQTWGNSFLQDKAIRVTKEHWVCIETMVKLNDVGKANGELALWIDGQLCSHLRPGIPRGRFVFDKFFPDEEGEGVMWDFELGDRRTLPAEPGGTPFPGFSWRTDEDLKANFVWLYLYITQGSPGHINRVWFDDLVVATSYIGPLAQYPSD